MKAYAKPNQDILDNICDSYCGALCVLPVTTYADEPMGYPAYGAGPEVALPAEAPAEVCRPLYPSRIRA